MPNDYPIVSHRELGGGGARPPGLVPLGAGTQNAWSQTPAGPGRARVLRLGDGGLRLAGDGLPFGAQVRAVTEVDVRDRVTLAVETVVPRTRERRSAAIRAEFRCTVSDPVLVAETRSQAPIADLAGYLTGLVQQTGRHLALGPAFGPSLKDRLAQDLDPLTGNRAVFGLRIEVGDVDGTVSATPGSTGARADLGTDARRAPYETPATPREARQEYKKDISTGSTGGIPVRWPPDDSGV